MLAAFSVASQKNSPHRHNGGCFAGKSEGLSASCSLDFIADSDSFYPIKTLVRVNQISGDIRQPNPLGHRAAVSSPTPVVRLYEVFAVVAAAPDMAAFMLGAACTQACLLLWHTLPFMIRLIW